MLPRALLQIGRHTAVGGELTTQDKDLSELERTSLTERADDGVTEAQLPPLLLVLFLAALSTPMILAWWLGVRSVWATLGSLVIVWVVCPAGVCSYWPRVRKLIRDEVARTCRNPGCQLLVAFAIGVLQLAAALAVWHYFKEPLGLPPRGTRAKLSAYGLDDTEAASDIFLIAWITLVNPVMEEFFWRLFVMQLLLAHWGDSKACGQPRGGLHAAFLVTSVFYAAYHVPVVAALAPLPLACVAGLGLVGLGAFFQALTQAGYLIVAVGIHLSCDAVAMAVFADIVWPDFPLRERAL